MLEVSRKLKESKLRAIKKKRLLRGIRRDNIVRRRRLVPLENDVIRERKSFRMNSNEPEARA